MIEENRGNGIWKEEGALTESTGTNRTRNRRRSGESLIKGGERKSYKEEEPHEGLTLLLHEGGSSRDVCCCGCTLWNEFELEENKKGGLC